MSRQLRVLTLLGTRPEAIKMAPVIKALQAQPEAFKLRVCVTGQHRQMLDQALSLFGITPDIDLDLMQPNQRLSQFASKCLTAVDRMMGEERPDWLLVQGDTTSVMIGSLVAYFHHVRIGHVEAGLRTWNKWQPFPEEINRRITDVLSDLYFAPTESARHNLVSEGTPDSRIVVTGNTIVDALNSVLSMPFDLQKSRLNDLPINGKRVILVTMHRRESFGKPLARVCEALREIVRRHSAQYHIIFPVHPNPNVNAFVHQAMDGTPGISLLDPLGYLEFVHLARQSFLILTDSGGIQEEAPTFRVPVLVLRDTTERPEGIDVGVARLVGTNPISIIETVEELMDSDAYQRMTSVQNPYGDGHAADRIARCLLTAREGQPSPH